MSGQENTRVVQELYAAFMRGDVPAIMDEIADTVEWHRRGAPAIPWGSRSSKDKVLSFFSELNDAVQFLGFEAKDYVAQSDKVVALGTFKPRARPTWREFEEPCAMVWTF